MTSQTSYDYSTNFILVGDTNVGKSCLLLDFLERGFKEEHMVTIGMEFGTKIVTYDERVYKLLLWDTAGQETFNSVTKSYYKNAVGVLLVYDVTNEKSFENITKWLSDIQENTNNNLATVLVGNKTDMEKERAITYEQGENLAKERGFSFIETSARLNTNVEEAFMKVVELVNDNIKSGRLRLKRSNSITVNTNKDPLRPKKPSINIITQDIKTMSEAKPEFKTEHEYQDEKDPGCAC